MKYLIDTDWVIDHFNNVKPAVLKLASLAPEGVAISVISLAELYEGAFISTDHVSYIVLRITLSAKNGYLVSLFA